jgi:hypothetical protein
MDSKLCPTGTGLREEYHRSAAAVDQLKSAHLPIEIGLGISEAKSRDNLLQHINTCEECQASLKRTPGE